MKNIVNKSELRGSLPVRWGNLTILLICLSFGSMAQKIHWASEVLDFSSELSSDEYAAKQALGKPNAILEGGDNPTAWMPSRPNKIESITVGFKKAIRIEQIVIAESYNPSGVFEIYLYDKDKNEHLVHTFEPRPVDLKSRLLHIRIEKTRYPVHAMRLVVDGRKVPGYIGIDAIGVSSSRKKVKIEIQEAPDLSETIFVERLAENVNSEYEETRPLISPDGKTLFFSRANHPENIGGIKDDNDIWYSQFDQQAGEWQESRNLGAPLNNRGPNFISSITPDGNAMTVILGNEYKGKNKMKAGVSVSTKSSSGWSEPEALDIINAGIETMDGNYFLANNRKVMIMAIDRFDAFGRKDLYVSFIQDDGRWTEPLNLGNDINTAHLESSPYLAADNETLYFSSKGYNGYGGSDVYISRRLDDTWTNWTEPENLGPDINSTGDDEFFNIPPSGKFAYYVKASKEGTGDIYRIAMPIFYQPSPAIAVSGKVFNKETNEPVQAKISYNLQPENTNVGFVMSDSLTGEYEILLPAGSSYDCSIEAIGFESAFEQFDLLDDLDFKEIERNIHLTPGTVEPVVVVVDQQEDVKVEVSVAGEKDVVLPKGSVTFEFNSDKLDASSFAILDCVLEIMEKNEEMNLVISGYADYEGSPDYNLRLSRRRADAVLQYFLQAGVPKNRFEVNGCGESNPVASNATPEGRQQNRRVEFSIKE